MKVKQLAKNDGFAPNNRKKNKFLLSRRQIEYPSELILGSDDAFDALRTPVIPKLVHEESKRTSKVRRSVC